MGSKLNGYFLGAALCGHFMAYYNALRNTSIFKLLRSSLALAELERRGGLSPHISPFTEVRDIGSLLTRAGFTMLTIDTDEIVIGYPSIFELITDIKGMGENNAAWKRSLHIRRETLFAAAAIYKELYGKEEAIRATFQIIYMLGWKPHSSQPKPMARGSGEISFKDLHKLNEIVKETNKIKLDDDTFDDTKSK